MRYVIRHFFNIFRVFLLNLKSKSITVEQGQMISVKTEVNLAKSANVHIKQGLFMDGFCRVIAGDNASLKIGKNCCANMGTLISATKKVSIGDHCLFGPGVVIVDNDHKFMSGEGVKCNELLRGEITIGDECWFGSNVTVLRDTHIGNGCIIGAGCVIKGDIPDNSIITNKQDLHIHQIEDR